MNGVFSRTQGIYIWEMNGGYEIHRRHSFRMHSFFLLMVGCVNQSPSGVTATSTVPVSATVAGPGEGIHQIQHIIIVLQENHAFDNYFGTYPGAEGIPMENGIPTVCIPNPAMGSCVYPFHDSKDTDADPPHDQYASITDIDGGKMDGFIRAQQEAMTATCNISSRDPVCQAQLTQPDVMGYYDDREIPNYWKYVDEYVLQDHMFASAATWSLPTHLFIISAWSAKCSSGDPLSCVNALQAPDRFIPGTNGTPATIPEYAWTDITYLLHRYNVSWAY
jgi:phospholipase C